MKILNQQIALDFIPCQEDFHIYLVSTNTYTESINEERLLALKGKLIILKELSEGECEKEHLFSLEEINDNLETKLLKDSA